MPKNLLLIPESRKQPITNSLLYKQIVSFLQSENIAGDFDIVFISIADGIIEVKNNREQAYQTSSVKPPSKNFRSGCLWISQEIIEEMAENIAEYLYKNANKYNLKIAYVRGAYLATTRLAVKKSGIEIEEIFTERQLEGLKKKGIQWMKVGLRMTEAFEIFQKRIKGIFQNNENKQLKLF